MASSVATILLIASIVVAVALQYHHHTCHSDGTATSSTHLHFYMHDDYASGHPTAATILRGRPPLPTNGTADGAEAASSSPRLFGDIAVMNNALTEGPSRGSMRVGTAQGFTVRVAERGSVNALSLHLVMAAGEYAGSSLVVQGRVDTDLDVRESVIVGGTGRFRLARGYALSRSYDYDLAKGGIVEIDVYLL